LHRRKRCTFPWDHKHHLLEKDLYQVVLHRPVEPAGIITTYLRLRLLVGRGFRNIYPHPVASDFVTLFLLTVPISSGPE
jgi:hypothetical protein